MALSKSIIINHVNQGAVDMKLKQYFILCRYIQLGILLFLSNSMATYARVGETVQQCVERYGPPVYSFKSGILFKHKDIYIHIKHNNNIAYSAEYSYLDGDVVSHIDVAIAETRNNNRELSYHLLFNTYGDSKIRTKWIPYKDVAEILKRYNDTWTAKITAQSNLSSTSGVQIRLNNSLNAYGYCKRPPVGKAATSYEQTFSTNVAEYLFESLIVYDDDLQKKAENKFDGL